MSEDRTDDIIFHRLSEIREIKKIRPKEAKPFPPSEIEHEEIKEDDEWRRDGVYTQISKTYDQIMSREIKDNVKGYFIIETQNIINHPTSIDILNRFDAKILTHLRPYNCRVFVESPFERIQDILESRKLKTIENNTFLIRPLYLSEIINISNYDREWHDNNNNVIIKIIPSINIDKKKEYIQKTIIQLRELGIEEDEYINREYTYNKSMIFTKTTIPNAIKIVENNNLIYRIYKSPKLKVSGINHNNLQNAISNPNITSLYPVCIMDTGVNKIPQLNQLLIHNTHEDIFNHGNDADNHGTPIACLVTFGEGNSNLNPYFNIISHRLFSPSLHSGDLIRGVINAINLHKNKTKVFISSVSITDDDEETRKLTQEINNIIHEENVCVIFSSGNNTDNIDPPNYPNYIRDNKVYHPSDAINICCVGSLTKRDNQHCYAPPNAPSPFTRCGNYDDLELHASIKPENVQHGGNLTLQENSDGVGIQTIDNSGNAFETSGTSFSSPLFARIIAGIYNKYSNNFNNCETAKAIAYSSCRIANTQYEEFLGFGEGHLSSIINVPRNLTKIAFEGNIPLDIETEEDEEFISQDIITFNVPAGVKVLTLSLVNTDNYYLYEETPKLFTYLSVTVFKPGRVSQISPTSRISNLKSHAKKFSWSLSRGTIGRWKFVFTPRCINIPREERFNVNVRYGAVLRLYSRSIPIGTSLTQMFKEANGILS